ACGDSGTTAPAAATVTWSSATRAGSTNSRRPSSASSGDGSGSGRRADDGSRPGTVTSSATCRSGSPGSVGRRGPCVPPSPAATPTVGVIGLGYVGLPLAVAFAESGATVIGVDVDPTRVARVRAGESFVEDVPASTLARLVTAKNLTATDDIAALKDADAILI